MATKKLTVEVDADVTKAKRKLGEMESSGGGAIAPAVDTAAERTARALERTGKSVEDFGSRAEKASGNLGSIVKAFTGMGVGLAMNYAARNLEDGSVAQRSVKYGASAIQYGSMGAMAGPWGAAAGAAIGLGKEFLDQSAADKQQAEAEREAAKARRESFEAQTKSIEKTREWKALLDGLTNTESNLSERQRELAKAIEERESREKLLKAALAGEAGPGGDDKNFAKLSQERGKNAAEIDALKALSKQLEKETEKTPGESAMDYSAVDSLARVGGSFAASEDGWRNLQKTNEEQLATLKSIESKTGKGATFT